MRDSEEIKVDGQNRLIVDDLKRQKVDGLKVVHSVNFTVSAFSL